MKVSELEQAFENYKRVEKLIPGYKWGDDTKVILDFVEKYLKENK